MDDILKNKSDKNMDAARLGFLQSPFLGPESTIAKSEWQLWRLKLELLQKSQSSEMFETTADLLRRARTKDEAGRIADSRFSDWLVWQLYIEAASSNMERPVIIFGPSSALNTYSFLDTRMNSKQR